MAMTSSSADPVPMWYLGQHQPDQDQSDHEGNLRLAQDFGYDTITTPITTNEFQSRVLAKIEQYKNEHTEHEQIDDGDYPLLQPLTPDLTDIAPAEYNSSLIGLASDWIDLGSSDPLIAHVSKQVLKLELEYAAFSGIQNVLVRGPLPGSDVIQYARAVSQGLSAGAYLNLHILLPMTDELELDTQSDMHLSELARPTFASEDASEVESDNALEAWEVWDRVRTLCNYDQRLGIALEIPRQLPPSYIRDRWFSEPVRMAIFPRTSFLRNAKGYPVLHKNHQHFLTRLMDLRFPPWILLSDVGVGDISSVKADPTPAEAVGQKQKDPTPHLRYIRHLQQNQPPRPPMLRFGYGYQDYIQSPLQPLTDNLESITYEVFEKDPVKYDWYEQATALALEDLSAKLGEDRPIIVAVVGAGRGPLVSKALSASRSSAVPIRCWAVEKNPNAYVHLQRRNTIDSLWAGEVTVVKTDMRAWAGPVIDGQVDKVEILISELLGSFADNELSPECLDGVQHVLHPDHGINIPQTYSAHLTPISTPRLYHDLLSRPGSDKWEIPAVVMLHQLSFLSTDTTHETQPYVKEAWSFRHPLPNRILKRAKNRAGGSSEFGGPGGAVGGDGSNEHNSRSCKVTFPCRYQGVCHGLAGYFETVLYASDSGKKIELSTNPLTMEDKSQDMISWFPIFFPLKTPLHAPTDSQIEVTMWRFTDDRKVWYEWVVEVYTTGKTKHRIAMSELHSSRKFGCLM